MKKGKVAYLCLQPLKEGQASYAHVYEIIQGLRKRGWEVTLYHPQYKKGKDLPSLKKRLVVNLIVQMTLWWHWLWKAPFQAVYIRHHVAAFPTAFLARILGIPVIQEINGHYEDLFLAWPSLARWKKVIVPFMRSQYFWARWLITVTEPLKAWLEKEAGREKVSLISNGANTQIFHPRVSPHRPDLEPYALFFGALATWQGIPTLLEAHSLPAWPEEVSLVILGDGRERQSVEEAASRRAGLVYLGTLPYQQVPSMVTGSLLGFSVKSSTEEQNAAGFMPLKVFETLACGVPVIVSDFPGQADLVRENLCGIVVPPDDPTEVAESVAFLYQNPSKARQMGERGRVAIAREHSWDARARATELVFKKFLERNF